MKRIDKRFHLIYLAFFIVLLSLIIVFSLNNCALDLALSKAIVSINDRTRISNSHLANFFEVIGVLGLYLFAIFCAFLLEYAIRDNKIISRKVTNMVRIILLVLAIGIAIFASHHLLKVSIFFYTNDYSNPWQKLLSISLFVTIPSGLVICYGLYFLANILAFDKKEAFMFVIFMLTAAFLSFLTVNAIKSFVPRNRYRAMWFLNDGDFSLFTPWYQKGIIQDLPLALSDDFKSFPSGHTTSTACLLALSFMPFYITKTNTKRHVLLLNIIPITLVIALMISRVICGAHFMSDVLIALFICSLYFYISNLLYSLIIQKRVLKNVNE